jgi:hypothetical protein
MLQLPAANAGPTPAAVPHQLLQVALVRTLLVLQRTLQVVPRIQLVERHT